MSKQTIRIIHVADSHVGYKQYGFAQREQDFYTALQQVFSKAIQHEVDAILIAGDLFDSTKPPAAAVLRVREWVENVKVRGIKVLGIDGNHDMANGDWLKVCGIEHIGGVIRTLAKGGLTLDVAGIDACRPAVFEQKVNELNALREGKPIQVIAIHQAVAELCDFPVQDYTVPQLIAWLKPLGVQYVALGDIHVYRETVFEGIRFAYSGSTEVNAVDEPLDKSCSIITYDGTKVTTEMVPLQIRAFKMCSLETEKDVDNILAMMTTADQPFIVGRYSADKRDLAKRAETLLRDAGCMYRIMPYAGDKNVKTPTFERKVAMLQLKDAVAVYFEPASDESQLVFQLLAAPDSVRQIMQAYMKSKGL